MMGRALIGGLALVLYLVVCVAVAKAADDRPNIVFLLADDLGSRGLGRYGGPVKTPVLDGLATKEVRFTDFHATSYSPC